MNNEEVMLAAGIDKGIIPMSALLGIYHRVIPGASLVDGKKNIEEAILNEADLIRARRGESVGPKVILVVAPPRMEVGMN